MKDEPVLDKTTNGGFASTRLVRGGCGTKTRHICSVSPDHPARARTTAAGANGHLVGNGRIGAHQTALRSRRSLVVSRKGGQDAFDHFIHDGRWIIDDFSHVMTPLALWPGRAVAERPVGRTFPTFVCVRHRGN